MTYWQIIVLLCGAAAFFILWPLFGSWFSRNESKQAQIRAAANARLYEEHVAEYQQSLDRGDISAEQFEALKLEQQRALLEDVSGQDQSVSRRDGKLLMIAFAALVPVLGWLMYHQLGARGDWEIHQAIAAWRSGEQGPEFETQLRHDLARRLESRPDNTQNWYILANLAMNVQDYDQAVDAFRQIVEREPESPQILAELAQALFLEAGNKVTPEVRKYTLEALEIDPNMPTALGLAGIDAFQQGYFQQAIKAWTRAVDLLGENAPGAKALISGIARAKGELEARGQVLLDETDVADGPALNVTVALADAVDVNPAATVFVYVRAFGGAPMPLAIQRFSASELPKTVRLDESMAMAPGMSMSTFKELEVVARISESGNAVSQSGDWQVTQGPITLNDEEPGEVSLVIEQQIP